MLQKTVRRTACPKTFLGISFSFPHHFERFIVEQDFVVCIAESPPSPAAASSRSFMCVANHYCFGLKTWLLQRDPARTRASTKGSSSLRVELTSMICLHSLASLSLSQLCSAQPSEIKVNERMAISSRYTRSSCGRCNTFFECLSAKVSHWYINAVHFCFFLRFFAGILSHIVSCHRQLSK